jgi:hypothetical protein
MDIRRSLVIALALALFAAGCSKKAEEAAPATSTDSLVSTSPIEQPEPGLEPQAQMPEQPAPAPTPAAKPKPKPATPAAPATPAPAAPKPEAPTATVAAGTGIKVKFDVPLSSETAALGQEWTGSVVEAVTVGNLAPFPAGSVVHGVVEGVKPAQKGDRAVLVLRVVSIEANGRTLAIGATADSLIAGSTRARNVGAIAGGAAAGALIGQAVSGSGKGALIGGLLGGAAAGGAVAGSKGYQVTIKEGAELVFRVDRDTKLKL